ncbi:sporulation protein YlmC/YmxH family [Clostridium sp. CAG:557]|jgi:YlmC/YmxH family sporulation protein|nr:sporulation protein YlmC/YmxH family [Clostridium sp. CAG:557]
MRCRVVDMRNKEVINVKTGVRLGCVSDVEIDTKDAKLLAIVIYGRLRWCGLLGREDDIIIKWDDIEIIGEDTILVKHNVGAKRKRRRFPELKRFLKI